MAGKIFSFLSMAFLTVFVLWGVGWLWFAAAVTMTAPEQEQKATEAIIVLTGGNGRVNEGLNLLHDDKAPKLFISGVNKDVSKNDIYASWQNKNGARPCCVYLGYEAIDTSGNADEVKKWVRKNNITSMRLVTSNYHMTRAFLEVSTALPDVNIIRHAVISSKDFENWRGRFWSLTFIEYNKSLIQWLRLYRL